MRPTRLVQAPASDAEELRSPIQGKPAREKKRVQIDPAHRYEREVDTSVLDKSGATANPNDLLSDSGMLPRRQSTVADEDAVMDQSANFSYRPPEEEEEDRFTVSDGSGEDDDRTFSGTSGSSGSASGATIEGSKSFLPAGMTMVHVMVILIMIPVIFLVTYTAIPLAEAMSAANYLDSHKQLIVDVMDGAFHLERERRDSSIIITTLPNASDYATLKADLDEARSEFDRHMSEIIHQVSHSDMELREHFLRETQQILQHISEFRRSVDLRNVRGPELRFTYLREIEEMYGFIMMIGKDPRAEQLRARILGLTIIRRAQNSLGMLRDVVIGYLSFDGDDKENHEAMEFIKFGLKRDVNLIEQSGYPEAVEYLHTWYHTPQWTKLEKMVDDLINMYQVVAVMTGDRTTISKTEFVSIADNLLELMDHADHKALDIVVNGKILNDIALTEGMKMFGAVLACVIACVVVIWLNAKEQERMERALNGARTLAKAVQRFVPKNQLKTMGVRSITQVTSGLQVEVAQTMLFSDIRDFTRMSEEMSNTQLFEWLQNYVSRMTKVTVDEKGYVDKFIGDALFCIFPQPTNAVRAGVNMQVSTDQLNLELVASGHKNLVAIGVGIHYGVVIAGVFGDDTRLSCTMVASDVNLASRLESLTKSFGAKIVASDAVVGQIDISQFAIRCLGKVVVSGASKPMLIFDIFQTDPVELKRYKEETLKEFEKAIKLQDTDEPAASAIFEYLSELAGSRGVKDIAAVRHIESVVIHQNSGQNSPSGGVLELENTGELRLTPRMGGSESPFGNNNNLDPALLGSARRSPRAPMQQQQQPFYFASNSPNHNNSENVVIPDGTTRGGTTGGGASLNGGVGYGSVVSDATTAVTFSPSTGTAAAAAAHGTVSNDEKNSATPPHRIRDGDGGRKL